MDIAEKIKLAFQRKQAARKQILAGVGSVVHDLDGNFARTALSWSMSDTSDKKARRKIHAKVALEAASYALSALSEFNLKGDVAVSYSGMRRDAGNGAHDITKGLIRVSAELKPVDGMTRSIDIPIQVREGYMLQPSIFYHQGTPYIMCQSAFDEILASGHVDQSSPSKRKTMFSPVAQLESEAAPLGEGLWKEFPPMKPATAPSVHPHDDVKLRLSQLPEQERAKFNSMISRMIERGHPIDVVYARVNRLLDEQKAASVSETGRLADHLDEGERRREARNQGDFTAEDLAQDLAYDTLLGNIDRDEAEAEIHRRAEQMSGTPEEAQSLAAEALEIFTAKIESVRGEYHYASQHEARPLGQKDMHPRKEEIQKHEQEAKARAEAEKKAKERRKLRMKETQQVQAQRTYDDWTTESPPEDEEGDDREDENDESDED